LEIVQKDKLILILGEAGSGKTTLLRYISNHQANSCLETLKIRGQVTFPVYVNFSRFKEGDLLDYFKTTLPPDIFSLLQKRPTDFKSWRFIYLLDGLDEIPLDNIPDRLRSIFSNSMSFKAASDLVILSSRPIFYESYRSTFELWPIQVYHLARLTWEQISSYCKQKGCEPKELFKESARLDFDELLRNPLNLKLALDLLKTEGQLPSTKSNLFERIVQWKTVLQCSYEDEETLTVALGIFKPHIEVDAIRPDVDVALPREVSLCPLPVLRLPDSLQADDVCGGEAGGVGTEECFQCGHHVAGGDTLQVEDGP